MISRTRFLSATLLAFFFHAGLAFPGDVSDAQPLAQSRQLLVVTAATWDSASAELRRFEREKTSEAWRAVDAPIKVSIGRSGLGWGRGLHDAGGQTGPVKREGDGRAPAGIFALTALFAYADPDSPLARAAKLPYLAATANLQCVDDAASSQYNRIVDRSQFDRADWASHEDMRRKDDLYSLGVVVAHNTNPAVPNAGSCIFLHVWRGEGQPTAGCTASSAANMAGIFRWLRGEAKPLLVQLPQAEYRRLQGTWQLP